MNASSVFRASFPGMKLAVEKYREDKDVKFVFVDTWENGEKEEIRNHYVINPDGK